MRGFKWQTEYVHTGFLPFQCQECGLLVHICGKVMAPDPDRWITKGKCKNEECVNRGDLITTRIEPAVEL